MRLLSRNAFGNFQTLIREVTLSPTMTKYLDNGFNRCTRNAVTCPERFDDVGAERELRS